MKRILPVLLVGVLILSGFGAGVAVNTESKKLLLQEDLYFSEPVLIDQNNYLTVEIKEATSSATSPGNPILPIGLIGWRQSSFHFSDWSSIFFLAVPDCGLSTWMATVSSQSDP